MAAKINCTIMEQTTSLSPYVYSRLIPVHMGTYSWQKLI